MRSLLPLALVLALSACGSSPAVSTGDAAVVPQAPVSAPTPAALSAPPVEASAAPTATATASAAATAAASAPSAAPSADPADGPLPRVGVSNIGMHIGGGPNDDVTKEPIRRSVAPHFDEFRRCFARVEDPSKTGDFGVDLRIDRAGGKAQVSHPRTALKGRDFKDCVVKTFEAIDFLKPKGGTTTVSYSLRFTPGTPGK